MKSKKQTKKSKKLQKGGGIVICGALIVSLLKVLAGAVATSFLNGVVEAGGGIEYYLPMILAHVLIFAIFDAVFFFVLKSHNIKYGIKAYLALSVIPVAFFASQLIYLILSSRSNEPSMEPVIVWLVMSLGLSFFTVAIGHVIKPAPRKA